MIQQQVLDFSHQGKLDDMLRLLNAGFKECTDLMNEQINKRLQINKAGARQASAQVGGQYERANLAIIGVCSLTILLAWVLTRSIVTPLERALQAAQAISASNLTQQKSTVRMSLRAYSGP